MVAPDLIGCQLIKKNDHGLTKGTIVETEAYSEEEEALFNKASKRRHCGF